MVWTGDSEVVDRLQRPFGVVVFSVRAGLSGSLRVGHVIFALTHPVLRPEADTWGSAVAETLYHNSIPM